MSVVSKDSFADCVRPSIRMWFTFTPKKVRIYHWKMKVFFSEEFHLLCWVEFGGKFIQQFFLIVILGLMKKLEQKINVYLKIDVSSRSTELPMALKMREILIKFFLTFSCIDMIHCRKWYVFRAIPNWSSIIVSFSVWFRIRKWKRVPWWDRGGSLWVELILK